MAPRRFIVNRSQPPPVLADDQDGDIVGQFPALASQIDQRSWIRSSLRVVGLFSGFGHKSLPEESRSEDVPVEVSPCLARKKNAPRHTTGRVVKKR